MMRTPIIAGIFIIVIFVAVAAGTVHAQSQLTLADFDSTGLEMDTLFLIQAAGSSTILSTPDNTASQAGAVLAGDRTIGVDNSGARWTWFRYGTFGTNVDTLRIQINNNDSAVQNLSNLSTYFGTGGTGRDLTLYIQDTAGVESVAINGAGVISSVSSIVMHINMPDAMESKITGLSNGNRFIFGMGRASTPAPPTNLTATWDATTTSVDLAWTAPTSGATVDGYQILRKLPGEASFTVLTADTGNTGLTYSDANAYNAQAAHTVEYVVRSRSGTAVSGDSNTASVNVPRVSAPDAPATPTVNVTGHDSVVVSWVPPTSHGSAITDYDVRYKRTADSIWEHQNNVGNIISLPITGLSPHTEYEFQIRATNSIGTSLYSNSGTGTTQNRAPTTQGAITANPSTVVSTGVVSLDATANIVDADGDPLTYEWTATPAVGTFSSTTIANPTWTSPFTNTGQSVTISVRATDGFDYSPSLSVTITVQAYVPPTPTIPPTWTVGAVEPAPVVHAPTGYLSTVWIAVGTSGAEAGAVTHDYGGFIEAAQSLPGLLFTDGLSRKTFAVIGYPADGVNPPYLRIVPSYPDGVAAHKSGTDLRWLRLQLRPEGGDVFAGGDLWDTASACPSDSICANLEYTSSETTLNTYDTKYVAVDFWDAEESFTRRGIVGGEGIVIYAEEDSSAITCAGNTSCFLHGELPQGLVRDSLQDQWTGSITLEAGEITLQAGSNSFQESRWRDYNMSIIDEAGTVLFKAELQDTVSAISASEMTIVLPTGQTLDLAAIDETLVRIEFSYLGFAKTVERTPGGIVAGQLFLAMFTGGVVLLIGGKKIPASMRVAFGLIGATIGSLILPLMGFGNLFFGYAIVAMFIVATGAIFALKRRG